MRYSPARCSGALISGALLRCHNIATQPPVSREGGAAAIAAYDSTPCVWLGVGRGGRPPAGALSVDLFPGLSLPFGAGGVAAALLLVWGAGAEAGAEGVDAGATAGAEGVDAGAGRRALPCGCCSRAFSIVLIRSL